jgi:HAE1 family hydrophobic/amphiphilic exporter-1
MSSMVGMFFKEFALTVSVATVFSLFMSFTLTPMLASILIPKDEKKSRMGEKIENFMHRLQNFYKGLLTKLLSKRKNPVILAVVVFAVFLIVLIGVAPKIGFAFFPDMDEGNFNIEVELPQGYSLEQSASVMTDIEKAVTGYPEIEKVLTTIGDDRGTHKSVLNAIMVPADQREIKSYDFIQVMIKELSSIPNAIITVNMGNEHNPAIQFFLKHTDREVIEKLEPIVREKLETIPGLVNFNTSMRIGKPELVLIPKREEMAQAGVTAYELGLYLRNAAEGVTPTVYREKGLEYDIRLALSNESIDTPEEVENLSIMTPSGEYTVSQLATVSFAEGPTEIRHRDKLKAIEFSGATAPGVPLNNIVTEVNKRLDEIDMPSDVTISWDGQSQMMGEAMLDFGMAFLIAIILTYMLLASLLESFTRPFIIMLSLPLATIGVFLLMWISGQTMNIISMMSIIMLIGLVVNDAILILDYTAQVMEKKKVSLKEAILEAAPTKMKAVIMTTLAIQLGMLPMALGIGTAGAEYRIPMAIIQIGGMMTSTVLTLFLIPGLYFIVHREKK